MRFAEFFEADGSRGFVLPGQWPGVVDAGLCRDRRYMPKKTCQRKRGPDKHAASPWKAPWSVTPDCPHRTHASCLSTRCTKWRGWDCTAFCARGTEEIGRNSREIRNKS